jgi:prepilin-type N-terminal cleavage/methylation domain-containing protein
MARRTTGFTLLEIMVTIAIIGILTTLALAGLDRLRKAADLSASLHTMVAHVSEARMQAMRRAVPVMLLVYVPEPADNAKKCKAGASQGSADGQNCVNYFMFVDGGPTYLTDLESTGTLPDYDPLGTSPATGGDTVLERVMWGPAANLVTAPTAPPPPFQNVDVAGACSFCQLTSNVAKFANMKMGALSFQPDGTIKMTGGHHYGGSLNFISSNLVGGNRTLAITMPLGAARVF